MNNYQQEKPPIIALWLLKYLSGYNNKHSIVSDSEYTFIEILNSSGISKAKMWYWKNVITSFADWIKLTTYGVMIMFNNYLKIAFRNMRRYKRFTLINIFGLIVGITASILIVLFIQDERSYDSYHVKADRLYRMASIVNISGIENNQIATSAILNPTLRNEFPEISDVTTIVNPRSNLMQYKDLVFREPGGMIADQSYFKMFTHNFLKGDKNTALSQPNSVVITENVANKYFGDSDPMGKVLNISNQDYVVTGLIEDVPLNSHFLFAYVLTSMNFENIYSNTGFTNNRFMTFIEVKEGVQFKTLNDKIHTIQEKYIYSKSEDFWSNGNTYEYYLQPLRDIYLVYQTTGNIDRNTRLYIFMVIALFILLLACINFMNLTTAIAEGRAKEVGIRKVSGSCRGHLVQQFMMESMAISLMSLFGALILTESVLPLYNDFLGKNLSITYNNPQVIVFLILFGLSVGVISGSYPAFILSQLKPVSVLKESKRAGVKSSKLRSSLVIFQFAISISLIVCTNVVYKQMEFVSNKSLGFEKEQVLIVRNPLFLGDSRKSFGVELLKHPEILSVSLSNTLPGRRHSNWGATPESKDRILMDVCLADEGFAETMKLSVVDGRFFTKENTSDARGVILNQTAVEKIDWQESPLGKSVRTFGQMLNVVGVIKDYHYSSLRNEIQPMMIVNLGSGINGIQPNFASIRLKTDNIAETVKKVEKAWKDLGSNMPFEYSFLDSDFNNLYMNERQIGTIFTLFSLISVFISSLGLLGLSSFIAKQRGKEIAIRKVLGASTSNIVENLSKNLLVLGLLANILAWPVTWYMMNKWLEQFAYRTNIGFEIFLLPSIALMIFALLTVSFQSIKAAIANPVDSLRCE